MVSVSRGRAAVVVMIAALLLAGCSAADEPAPSDGDASGQQYPDVQDVAVSAADDGTYTFDVTISSPYDSAERYADGWRVLGPDGEVYGEMELTHDHASEQPFTRTQTGVEIPDGVDTVTVEGRDSENGYGGKRADVDIRSG
ncbi:hypothetical protein BH20ACT6_BH20ACT6_00960 [soil metagenome]